MKILTPLLLVAVFVFLAGLLPVDALAANDAASWKCNAGTSNLNALFCSMTGQFRFLPRLLSVFAYVIAAILAVQGLLQLKDYGDDPSKTPLQSIIIKLVLAAALISLPFAMQIFISTVTGDKDMKSAGTMSKPSLGKGVSGTNK